MNSRPLEANSKLKNLPDAIYAAIKTAAKHEPQPERGDLHAL
ncbi:MAG: hypothetical protein ABI346_10590 [Candidatus Baltobacteraceae bacterium]